MALELADLIAASRRGDDDEEEEESSDDTVAELNEALGLLDEALDFIDNMKGLNKTKKFLTRREAKELGELSGDLTVFLDNYRQ